MNKSIYISLIGLISIQLTSALPAFALFRESHVATDNNVVKITSSSEAGQFGSDIESGDFNADGHMDLLVASPFYSAPEKEWIGKVEIVWGGVDKSIDRTSYTGVSKGEQLGSSLAVGDFNGDGIDDIAMGAHNAFYGEIRTGKVYVINGVSHTLSQMTSRDFAYDRPDVRLNGNRSSDGLYGLSIYSMDADSDGYSDLLVGSPGASGPSKKNVGAVYYYKGGDNGLSKFSTKTKYGSYPGEMFGASVVGGFLNGDTKADLVVGSQLADYGDIVDTGAAYYFQNFLEKSNEEIKKTIYGDASNQWLGFRLGVADLNNDYKEDLIISSFPYKGELSDSRVEVYYGGAEFYTEFADINISSPHGSSLIGADLEFADLNNDGVIDIATGAPSVDLRNDGDPGRVYVTYSENGGFITDYTIKNGDVGTAIVGNEVDDWFGYSLEALDFNGDDIMDLAIGARYANGDVSVNDGAVHILIGNGDKFGEEKIHLAVGDESVVSRGEFIGTVVHSFNLEHEREIYLDNCYSYLEFCLFNFMAASYFDGISLEPDLLLYPDVAIEDEYYDEINLATVLGIVNGYLGEPESPFHPELPVTRIQALKIILGATNLVKPMYKFELEDKLGGEDELSSQSSYFVDIKPQIGYMWWYPRYSNFAADSNIVALDENFRPDDLISKTELDDMVSRTLEYLKTIDEENES
jgi:hypothetical protein